MTDEEFRQTPEYKQTLAYQSGEMRRAIKQMLTDMGIIGLLEKVCDKLLKYLS